MSMWRENEVFIYFKKFANVKNEFKMTNNYVEEIITLLVSGWYERSIDCSSFAY